MRNIWREAAAFGVIGAVAFVVEFTAFNVLISGASFSSKGVLHSAPVAASALATMVAVAVSWLGNRYWTYRDRKDAVAWREVSWFLGINLAGLLVTAAPVYVGHGLLGLDSTWSDNAARLMGWATATVLRFTVYRTLVFAEQGPARVAGSGPVLNPAATATVAPGTARRPGSERLKTVRQEAHWPWGLAAVAVVCGYAVAAVFHPGYLSPDSTDQLLQALRQRPVTDWHPPVLVLLWRALIHTTGAMSAMAALQVAVLWAALWVLAVLVWRRTGSRGLSLAVLAVGLAPNIVNLTGVVWSDVHLAYVLLAACAVALVARELPKDRLVSTRWALLTLGVLFLAYAVLVRKNAVPAVIPVFVLLVLGIWPTARGRRRWFGAAGLLVAVTVAGSAGVSVATDPVATHQYAQIPLDDLVHVLPPDQVRTAAQQAGASLDFRNRLVSAATTCQQHDIVSDAYFHCYPRDRSLGPTELGRHASVLVQMWTQQIPHHPVRYTRYRLRVFARLLFQGNQFFESGSTASARSIPAVASAPVDHQLKSTLGSYVTAFVRDVPLLFQGWFWLVVSLVLTLRRRWPGPYAREIRLLGASGALYILAYLPTVPESNYRYVYWPALGGALAALLVTTGCVMRRHSSAASDRPA
ncbi:hypothetical protein LK07_03120 [Streptomyces pluripotens]|uniref:GtrA/DPMS transmembrane domain-containing protein n=1 Tax=Streptomyces pluripotens TaxID=1355015 RepID=A0A221NT82_9ACTN|nr:hypothetical protein LK07_03120 [Streptomyces pluripotens]MCH0556922.1 GtrA family protein [Streptomyces sp. MUM 16J]